MSAKEVDLKIDMYVQSIWCPWDMKLERDNRPDYLKAVLQFQFSAPFLSDIEDAQFGFIAETIERELRAFAKRNKATNLFDAASKANPLDRLAQLDEELGLQ